MGWPLGVELLTQELRPGLASALGAWHRGCPRRFAPLIGHRRFGCKRFDEGDGDPTATFVADRTKTTLTQPDLDCLRMIPAIWPRPDAISLNSQDWRLVRPSQSVQEAVGWMRKCVNASWHLGGCTLLGLYMLLACGGGDEPSTPPILQAPAEPISEPEVPQADEPESWPNALSCPNGAVAIEADPTTTHPEFWTLLPSCRIHPTLNFRRTHAIRTDVYPQVPMPKGARHRWCPTNVDNPVAYEMLVHIPLADGNPGLRVIRGQLQNGLAHGSFEMFDPKATSEGPEITGTFVHGSATGAWSWTGETQSMTHQGLCPTVSGTLEAGIPVGLWHAELIETVTEQFEGSWTATGWQGKYWVESGRNKTSWEVVDSLRVKSSRLILSPVPAPQD